jgi:integrase
MAEHAPSNRPASNTVRVTIRVVEAIQPGEIVWDSIVRGFGVRCQRAKKVYILKANIGGRQRWFSIGEHGAPWTPDTARAEAQRLWGEIRSGTDIAAVREARRNRPTMSDLCSRYIEEHAREHKKASSAHLDDRNIENHVRPLLGELYVDEVTRADIDRFKRFVKEGKSRKPGENRRTSFRGGAVVTGGTVVANRCLSLLSKMFNLAEVWGSRPDGSNPVRHIGKYKEQRRERYLSADEFARLGDALAAALAEGSETPFAVAAVRLLVLTGARSGEILTLRWEHVDLQNSVPRLPDSKTGRKIVWLNPPAIEVLTSLPQIADNPFVIVGERQGAHLVNIRKPWERLCTYAGITNARIHDLRHSFASVAVASGVGLYLTGKILGHLRNSTTERYAHLADDPVRQANDMVGRRIADALKQHGARDQKATQ